MPGRMPMPSEMAPTMGSTMSPGMTQMAPNEKPIDLARGGMPSDRAANTPGPTMARLAAMAMLARTVSHNQGASANTTRKAAVTTEVKARKRMMSDGSFMMSLVPKRAPMTSPTICTGSVIAAMYERCSVSRPKASW